MVHTEEAGCGDQVVGYADVTAKRIELPVKDGFRRFVTTSSPIEYLPLPKLVTLTLALSLNGEGTSEMERELLKCSFQAILQYHREGR